MFLAPGANFFKNNQGAGIITTRTTVSKNNPRDGGHDLRRWAG